MGPQKNEVCGSDDSKAIYGRSGRMEKSWASRISQFPRDSNGITEEVILLALHEWMVCFKTEQYKAIQRIKIVLAERHREKAV